jgi:hypothetical protein
MHKRTSSNVRAYVFHSSHNDFGLEFRAQIYFSHQARLFKLLKAEVEEVDLLLKERLDWD